MDIFNTVVSAIDLAERVWKLIDNFRKVPERLRRLQVDVKSLQQTLERLQDAEFRQRGNEYLLEEEIREIHTTLLSLQKRILQYHQRVGSGVLSRSLGTLRTQMKLDDLDELSAELQKRKSSLSLIINTLVLGSIGNVDAIMQHAMISGAAMVRNTDHETILPNIYLSPKEFLDSLGSLNYAEDEIRVNNPTDGTAAWIYDRQEYKEWLENEYSASLHLVGKMGCGKSVLTKGIIKSLKQKSTQPNSRGSTVLYYFCSCVNRLDNSSSILKGFISQFVLQHEATYETSLGGSELLQSRKTEESAGWSFEALWHMFTKLLQGSGLSNLYCVIDALDECDSASLESLLSLLHQLSKDTSISHISFKLLFSTREYANILDTLDYNCSTRLFILPNMVVSDIRVAMQSDMNIIQKRLKLLDDEVGILQEAILKKSDGMFLWVSLATKDIMDNSYDATFEMLEELIENLPAGLKGLYEKNWVKLVDSLPATNVTLANKVLTWVLLAQRPMTISELTVALAIEPGKEKLPAPKKLLRNLSAFVLKYLAPFVEIITTNESVEPDDSASITKSIPVYKPADKSKVQLVHQSAQEYLLASCNDKTNSKSKFQIDLRDGHESLARICLTYLCSDELQLGWIDEENRDEWGVNRTTDLTRKMVKERLNTYPFLGYASVSWYFHVRKCQYLLRPWENQDEPQKDDIFEQSINFLKNFRQGYACSAQIRQLLMFWEDDDHYGPAPPMHYAAARHLSICVRRLLKDLNSDLRDSEGCTVLHYIVSAQDSIGHSEDGMVIMDMVLNAGVDINAVNKAGQTALQVACSYGQSGDINTQGTYGMTELNLPDAIPSKKITEYLIAAGADIETKDCNGYTPLLSAAASHSWETTRILVERGANCNAQENDGWSCLHFIAEAGENTLIKLLLQKGADINVKTKLKWAAIHCTARFNHLDSYKILVDNGADTSLISDEGGSISLVAAEYASVDFVQHLLDTQTGMNDKGKDNETLLHCAMLRNDIKLTQLLLEKGADPKAKDADGHEPLAWAIDVKNYEVAQYLLKFYVDDIEHSLDKPLYIACRNPDMEIELIEKLLELGASPNAAEGPDEMTPLHVAASFGYTKAVDMLLKYSEDIAKLNYPGVQPLTMAAKAGHLETTKFLVRKGADVNISGIAIGMNVLGLTCYNGHVEVVEWLLNNGADASLVSFRNLPIDVALGPNHNEIFRLLLQNLGDVNAEDVHGNAALYASVKYNKVELVNFLLKLGADVMKIDKSSGDSIFHAAAFAANVELFKILTKKTGLNFTTYLNDRHQTPAIIAAISGKLAALEHLAAIGPSETLRVTSPFDFEQILKNKEYTAILDLLSKHGALDIMFSRQVAHPFLMRTCFGNYFMPHNLDSFLGTLIKHGFKPDITDDFGRTILHRVVLQCIPEVAKLLLAHGSNVRLRDKPGLNTFDHLLYIAPISWVPLPPPRRLIYTRTNPSDLAAEALIYGKDGNILTDDTGGTILHTAALNGNKEIIEALLAKKLQIISDHNGWLPSMVAERCGFPNLAELLFEGEGTERKATTSPLKWSSKLKSVNLVLNEDSEIKSPETMNCVVEDLATPECLEAILVDRVFSIMADAPIPYEATEYYFEVEFLQDSGIPGVVAIGFACLPQSFEHTLPGWPRPPPFRDNGITSWGYHSYNGYRFPGNTTISEPYGEKWVAGDTVGCGVDVKEGRIWFVKNGKFQGFAFNNVKGQLYPIIGMSGGGILARGKLGVEPPEGWRDQTFIEYQG